MNDIICPNCGQAFKIDEAGYADILKQVRDREFEQQLQERLTLAERDKHNAVELAAEKIKAEMQAISTSKDAEIQKLKNSLEARDMREELAITEAVSSAEKQRDRLANELQQVRDNNITATRLAETKFAKEIQAITLQKEGELRSLKAQIESSDPCAALLQAAVAGFYLSISLSFEAVLWYPLRYQRA